MLPWTLLGRHSMETIFLRSAACSWPSMSASVLTVPNGAANSLPQNQPKNAIKLEYIACTNSAPWPGTSRPFLASSACTSSRDSRSNRDCDRRPELALRCRRLYQGMLSSEPLKAFHIDQTMTTRSR
jgi:hypothetical protein